MFRVYDKQMMCWINDDIYMSPNGDLYKAERGIFGTKLILLPSSKYIHHKFTDLYDKNNIPIYEGDIVSVKVLNDTTFETIGLVAYVSNVSYVVLDYERNKYYTLGNYSRDDITVIGNIFETPELLGEDNSNEQESK